MTASDPAVLESLYRTEAGLAARQSIYRWSRRPVDLPGEAVSELAGVTGVVVDVGCGNGAYVARLQGLRPDLRVLAVDLSFGMLAGLHASGYRALAVADAAALPLADDAADAALAMHMLYHLPNPGRGVAELRRVVRPGGPVLAVTNARDDKLQIDDLLNRALVAAGGVALDRALGPHRDFSLEASFRSSVPISARSSNRVAHGDRRTGARPGGGLPGQRPARDRAVVRRDVASGAAGCLGAGRGRHPPRRGFPAHRPHRDGGMQVARLEAGDDNIREASNA